MAAEAFTDSRGGGGGARISLMLPRYCCVILQCPERGFLLEQRPPTTRHAGGSVTCFGGGREGAETEEACAVRELREELGWTVGQLSRRAELYVGGRWIATFFSALPPERCDALSPEAGHSAMWVQPGALGATPLSQWHRAVLDAHIAGGPGVLRVVIET